jgi:hypothetical protein
VLCRGWWRVGPALRRALLCGGGGWPAGRAVLCGGWWPFGRALRRAFLCGRRGRAVRHGGLTDVGSRSVPTLRPGAVTDIRRLGVVVLVCCGDRRAGRGLRRGLPCRMQRAGRLPCLLLHGWGVWSGRARGACIRGACIGIGGWRPQRVGSTGDRGFCASRWRGRQQNACKNRRKAAEITLEGRSLGVRRQVPSADETSTLGPMGVEHRCSHTTCTGEPDLRCRLKRKPGQKFANSEFLIEPSWIFRPMGAPIASMSCLSARRREIHDAGPRRLP